MPRSEPSEMQIGEFARLPLAYQGRVKPYDTVARNTLQILSGRQELVVEQDSGNGQVARDSLAAGFNLWRPAVPTTTASSASRTWNCSTRSV